MAIIKKGTRYRPSDGDDDDRQPQTGQFSGGAEPEEKKEPPQKKGGLIKVRQAPAASTESVSRDPQQQHKARGGKVLKSAWLGILADKDKRPYEDDIFGDDSDYPDTGNLRKIGERLDSQKTALITTSVITIPSGNKPAEPLASFVEDVHDDVDSGEFEVETPLAKPVSVDVEALIAEAEARAQEKASKIIEHAQTEAKKLIDQAKIYGETAKADAYKEGMEQGRVDGAKAGRDEFKVHIEQATDMFRQLVRERERVLSGLEPELAKLAMEVAKKIIGEQVAINRDATVEIIRNAMTRIKSREEVSIKVNPDDVDYVRGKQDIFARMVEGLKKLEIVADPRVDRGGCIIETDLGNTDARLSVQISLIETAFERIYKEQTSR